MIDRQVVDEILARTDMQTLVGAYVPLKRSGSNLTGLCPFHSEKSPSFTVFRNDGSFYCFGCGVGGNAITFVRKVENLDFVEAVSLLARRAGITLHIEDKPGEARVDRKRYYEMNRKAAMFFHKALYAQTPDAVAALSYFTEKRGLSSATIKHFGLGYAPSDFSFVDYMRKEGYSEDELIQGFLCGRSEKGYLYPSFRNRVMFPIIDVSENVIAFGGRVMEKAEPKYKNSSDTPVFKKGSNLFALNFAHKSGKDEMILCEGYMDVIALHAAGYTNAVATLGTAIKSEQVRLLSRYTKRVILSYDSDEAGQKAADKALRLLEEVGLEVKVLKIPGAKDPDEYIQKNGAQAFRKVIDASSSKFEFNFERVLRKYDLERPQQVISAMDELCTVISGVYSSVEREIYISEAAKRLSVDARSIKLDVERKIRYRRAESKQKEGQLARRILSGYGDEVNVDFARMPQVAKAEETVLGLLQLYPEHRAKAFGEPPLLTLDDFKTDLGKRVFSFISDGEKNGGFAPELLDSEFSPDEVGRITKMRVSRMQLNENGSAAFSEAVDALKNALEAERAKEGPLSLSDLEKLLMKKRNEGEA